MSADLKMLSTAQVADLLNVDRTTIYRHRKRGNFPQPIQVCGTPRYRQSDILDYLESQSSNCQA